MHVSGLAEVWGILLPDDQRLFFYFVHEVGLLVIPAGSRACRLRHLLLHILYRSFMLERTLIGTVLNSYRWPC